MFHFIPTFAKPAGRHLKRGVFRSFADLQAAINRFLVETNCNTKPFMRTADPKPVPAAVNRRKQTREWLRPFVIVCSEGRSCLPGC
jgi:hypothetical protein